MALRESPRAKVEAILKPEAHDLILKHNAAQALTLDRAA